MESLNGDFVKGRQRICCLVDRSLLRTEIKPSEHSGNVYHLLNSLVC